MECPGLLPFRGKEEGGEGCEKLAAVLPSGQAHQHGAPSALEACLRSSCKWTPVVVVVCTWSGHEEPLENIFSEPSESRHGSVVWTFEYFRCGC